MDENLRQSYNIAAEKVALKERITISLEEKNQELEKLHIELKALKDRVKKEGKDVEKLEKISVANLFAIISGKKQEKLEKEELEFFNAKSELESFMLNVNSCEDLVKHYEKKLAELEGAEESYRITKDKLKEAIIQNDDTEISKRLKTLEDEFYTLKNQIREVDEVIVAGEKVLQNISKARNTLDSAENWGLYDAFGGGFFSSMVKQDRIIEAKGHIRNIEISFKEFDKELKDINMDLSDTLNLSNFDVTVDIWFDNIFTDFSVLNKIQEATKKVVALQVEIKNLLAYVQKVKSDNLNRINKIEKEIDDKINMF